MRSDACPEVIFLRSPGRCGHPPDMKKLATELVLRQVEKLAGEFSVWSNYPHRLLLCS